jgi:hypothetical protein
MCPLLGLESDRNVRRGYTTEEHRCYAESLPQPLDASTQREYCLDQRHQTCPRFIRYGVIGGGSERKPGLFGRVIALFRGGR